MAALVFNSPFESGLIWVVSSRAGAGTTTVSSLAQTKETIVRDIGWVQNSSDLMDECRDLDVQFLYVHQDEPEIPAWVEELSEIKPVVYVNYNTLTYSEKDWELMKTDHELLLALEKLLPEHTLIRMKRDEIRNRFE